MCEIFFAKAAPGKSQVKTETILNTLKQARQAAINNNDGFGVFRDDGDYRKAPRQLSDNDIGTLLNFLEGSKYFVLHVRLTTQGSERMTNTHPFHRDGFYLVHNGSVTVEDDKIWKNDDEVDSLRMLKSIVRHDNATPERIKYAMRNISGRASVFLRDHKNELYYFRQSAQFAFSKHPDTGEIIGATRQNRLRKIHDKTETEKPDHGKIFHITETNNVNAVETFEMDGHTKTWGGRSRTTTTTTSTTSRNPSTPDPRTRQQRQKRRVNRRANKSKNKNKPGKNNDDTDKSPKEKSEEAIKEMFGVDEWGEKPDGWDEMTEKQQAEYYAYREAYRTDRQDKELEEYEKYLEALDASGAGEACRIDNDFEDYPKREPGHSPWYKEPA